MEQQIPKTCLVHVEAKISLVQQWMQINTQPVCQDIRISHEKKSQRRTSHFQCHSRGRHQANGGPLMTTPNQNLTKKLQATKKKKSSNHAEKHSKENNMFFRLIGRLALRALSRLSSISLIKVSTASWPKESFPSSAASRWEDKRYLLALSFRAPTIAGSRCF